MNLKALSFFLIFSFITISSYGWALELKSEPKQLIKTSNTAQAQNDSNKLDEFQKVAEKGDIMAQYKLGLIYEQGQIVNQDYTNAAYWCGKAASQGYAPAQFHVGVMNRIGIGAPKDLKKAVYWFQKATAQGNLQAQSELGYMYKEGIGVPIDIQKGGNMLMASAEHNEPYAQTIIAEFYRFTPRSSKCILWLTKAAEQNYTGAQYRLYDFYNRGEIVPQDFQKAYQWLSLAAAHYSDAPLNIFQPNSVNQLQKSYYDQQLAELKAKMTPIQIQQSQNWVQNWKPTGPIFSF